MSSADAREIEPAMYHDAIVDLVADAGSISADERDALNDPDLPLEEMDLVVETFVGHLEPADESEDEHIQKARALHLEAYMFWKARKQAFDEGHTPKPELTDSITNRMMKAQRELDAYVCERDARLRAERWAAARRKIAGALAHFRVASHRVIE